MSLVRFPQINPTGAGPWADIELRTNTGVFISPLNGVTRTLERQGARWAMTLRYQSLAGADRDRLRAFIASMMGQANRCYVRDFSYTQRGSFTQSQVVTEPDFDNGGAGWTDSSSTWADVTFLENQAVFTLYRKNQDPFVNEDAIGVSTGVPYVARSVAHPIGGVEHYFRIRGQSNGGTNGEWFQTDGVNGTVEAPARVLAPFVPSSSSLDFDVVYDCQNTDDTYGDIIAFDHASVSRCALIDVSENLLTYSEQFDNAAWANVNTTISANVANFAGQAVADELIEDSDTSSTHYLYQDYTKSADEEMMTFSIYVRQGSGDRDIRLRIGDTSTTDAISATFDLSAGAAGTVSESGAAVLGRATIETLPNIGETGWYRCSLSGVIDAETTLRSTAILSNAGSITYNGDGTSSVYLFGAQLQFSHLAGFYRETTDSVLLASAAANPGNKVPVKGLPADMDGLLLPGDMVELAPVAGPLGSERTQLVRVVAPLNSDSGGKGYLYIEPGLKWTPDISNRYQVLGGQLGVRIEPCAILWRPEGRFMLDQESVREIWDANDRVSIEFTLVEDVAA